MKSRIITKFLGEINGVTINSEWIYHTCEYLLNNIEENFGECYNEKFVKDLADSLETIYLKYEELSISDIENGFIESINIAESFESIKFTIYGDDYKFEFLNNNRKSHML